MKDSEFKIAKHSCGDYHVFSKGNAIQKNYSPDFVLKSSNEYVLIEHETEPNRKTIIADIFKAAYFLQDEKKGILLIVLTPKGTSSFESYPNHVMPYFQWLKEKTNLLDVIFIHESNYHENGAVLVINGKVFIEKSVSLKATLENQRK